MTDSDQAAPGSRTKREIACREFRLTTAEFRSSRRTIPKVIQFTLELVESMLINARMLFGRGTWRKLGQPPKMDKGTQTHPCSTKNTMTQTEVVQQDKDKAFAQYVYWFEKVNPTTVLNHPLLQVALNRGIVIPETRWIPNAKQNPKRPYPPPPARTRKVWTNISMKQSTTFLGDPSMKNQNRFDDGQEDDHQLEVIQDEMPEKNMLKASHMDLPDSDDEGL